MKKILIALTAFMMITGTAYAAVSINGLYKGRSIVKVVVNGVEVKSTVPAQNIDGSTMLPLRAIGESLGAKVEWNQAKYQASVTMPQAAQTGLTLDQLNKIGESVGLIYQLDAQGKQIGTGSGFVTGSTFVTNWHVADGNAVSLLIDFGTIQKTVKVSDAVFKNETADLIGFKIDGVPGLSLNTEEVKKDDKIYTLSYPHHRFQISEGVVHRIFELAGEPYLIEHTAFTTSGSSGGVLLSVDGGVVGIVDSTTVFNGEDYGGAIPIKYLMDEMKANK